jgi:hypothetical protein
MKITASTIAKISLNEIVIFLQKNWTKKEILILKNDILKFKKVMKDGVIKHQNFENYPDVKFALIAKRQVKIIYRIISSEEIQIAIFWHCKQDPKKLNELLNKN